jgi:hypothetical protein
LADYTVIIFFIFIATPKLREKIHPTGQRCQHFVKKMLPPSQFPENDGYTRDTLNAGRNTLVIIFGAKGEEK